MTLMVSTVLTVFIFFAILALSSQKEVICSPEEECGEKYASFDFEGWEFPYGLYSNQREEVENVEVGVKFGKVPDYLAGSLTYRVGPGLYSLPGGERRLNNLIDGLAKLHCWSFHKSGKVTFGSKFIRSSVYNRSIAANEIVPIPHMGQVIPPLTFLEKVKVMLWDPRFDNTNIAIWNLSDSGVTTTNEQPGYIDTSFTTLNFMKEYYPVSPDKSMFEMEFLSASHFQTHPPTGAAINYKIVIPLDFGRTNPSYKFYNYHYREGTGEMELTHLGSVTVDFDDVRIVHSFGVTDRHVILTRFNLFVNTGLNVFKYGGGCDVGASIYWDGTRPSVFDTVDLDTGLVKSFDFTAREAQHIINSFERLNRKGELEIVLDFVTRVYQVDKNELALYDMLNIDWWRDPKWSPADYAINIFHKVRITRYVLNMKTGQGTETDFPVMWNGPQETGIEMPMINPHYKGKDYCHAYLTISNHAKRSAAGLLKVDLCQDTSIGWEEKNKFPVEPIFVARPGGTAEDDGVILSNVLDGINNSTLLYVWDAKNLEVVCIVATPITVPYTLHGLWFEGKY